jgi:Insertion element 4 transposase N-terminal
VPSSYPVPPDAVPVSAGMMIAVPLELAVSPLKSGRDLGGGDRSALVIGGTGKIRTGGAVVFCKVVAVAEAQVKRDGQVRAKGSPVHHATLGPLEERLESQAGPGAAGGIAGRAPLGARFVKGERERLLARAFMVRVIVLMTLMPDARVQDVIAALAGDLALIPWARPWRPASARAAGDWRNALGPVPLEELRDLVLGSAWRQHQGGGCPGAVMIGKERPLTAGSLDGTLVRVPDTPANRAAFGTVGTGDDSGPYPCLRALPLTCCSCRALFAMPHGPAGTDKAGSEQALLDEAMDLYPALFAPGWIWLMDRNYHGARRIARLLKRTHVLIRLKSDIPLKRTSEILPDGSYRAELSGDGVTVPVRVIEYWVTVEGQEVPEMFCLVTDLMDHEEYPARELAALYKWRWDGSETALREAKAPLRGAGPGTGPMLRSGSPDLVRQELAAWAAGTGMTRGVVLDAALAARPARKGRRAGLAVRPRDLSFARALRAVLSAIRLGHDRYQAVTSEIGRYRTVVSRGRHRGRKSKSPSPFPHAGVKDTLTRIAPAVITMANTPA